MGKGKPRHHPEKLVNQSPLNGHCCAYDIIQGRAYCESGPANPKCGGNRHSCCKVRYQEFAIYNSKDNNRKKKQSHL